MALFERLKPEKPEDEARTTLETFYRLTQQGNQFWRKQPFTPSCLSSTGIFDRVRNEMKSKDLSADWVDDVLGVQNDG